MAAKKILAGNWKMNLGIKDSRELAQNLAGLAKTLKKSELWVAPSAMALAAVAEALAGSPVLCGAQNVYWEKKGAFTGELSIDMLKEAGSVFAIVGHSERRHLFGETSAMVAQRVLGCLAAGFKPVFCIGEKLDQREAGQTVAVLQEQLDPVLAAIKSEQVSNVVIAYEPVWAIGTGKVATLAEVAEAHAAIHGYWTSKVGGACPPILYGGSVAPDNFEGIITTPLVAGCLIGGASLVFDKMKAMASAAERVC